jgi:hypothetical protein
VQLHVAKGMSVCICNTRTLDFSYLIFLPVYRPALFWYTFGGLGGGGGGGCRNFDEGWLPKIL